MKTENQDVRRDQKAAESQEERNKELVRRAVDEIWNRGNYGNLADFADGEFVAHTPSTGEDVVGFEGIRRFFSGLKDSFPDLHFTVDEQIAEADKVVTRWTARGTHKGEFNGIPATGKRVIFTSLDIDRIINGRVVECWTYMDELGLLRQLGALDAMGDHAREKSR